MSKFYKKLLQGLNFLFFTKRKKKNQIKNLNDNSDIFKKIETKNKRLQVKIQEQDELIQRFQS
jgi:hypothetical protein